MNRQFPLRNTSTALLAIAAVFLSAPVYARNFYVATNGNDSGSGNETEPFATIQKAVSQARAGDTVLVRAGVYRGHVYLRYSGEPGRPITLKNFPGESPALDGEGKGRIELNSEHGWRKPIGWITVEGFEVRNGWDGIKFYNAHHVILLGNHLHDNLNQGILGNGHHIRIEGNAIAHNGFKADNEKSNKEHGIYCTGTDFTIVNNIICSNRAYGLQVAGYAYQPDRHAGPEFADARRWLISHNTIAFNQNRGGIVVWQEGATDCVIQNNIFYQNSVTLGGDAVQGVDFVGAGGGHIIRNNLFFAPGRTSIGRNPGGSSVSNNLEHDPLFVAPEHFDFHLRKDSPAIDAGTSESPIPTDFDKNKRPQGPGHDAGAYEARQ